VLAFDAAGINGVSAPTTRLIVTASGTERTGRREGCGACDA